MTIEVPLPEQVGGRLLKALMSRSTSDRQSNAPVPAQDLVHRRDRGRTHPFALKAVRELARSPGRMGIAQGKKALLDQVVSLSRAPMGTA